MKLISAMEKTDYLDIGGKQLHLLLTIHNTGSLTLAANRLDMNQSTVSYQLDKLRQHFNDPLFIRSGQGVIATEKATQLITQARDLLHSLKAFSEGGNYDPAQDRGVLRIAANSLERDLVVKPLLAVVREKAPHLRIEICATGSANQVIDGLRDDDYDLVIFPTLLSNAEGIMQRSLTPMLLKIFYDANCSEPPLTLEEFCKRDHARVALSSSNANFEIDDELAKRGLKRHVSLQVGDFDTLALLIKGTDIITTQPDLHIHSSLSTLSTTSLPFNLPGRKLALFWHARYHNSSRHQFWRNLAAEHRIA